jgi:hypothetical protein
VHKTDDAVDIEGSNSRPNVCVFRSTMSDNRSHLGDFVN